MEIKFDEFESKYLGMKSGKVFYSCSEMEGVEPARIIGLSEEARKKKYELISIRMPAPRHEIADALKNSGFRCVEEMLTFSKRIFNQKKCSSSVRIASTADVEPISEIAESSFIFDRFHSDSLIDNNRANELKRAWARNCLAYRADRVFVFDDNKIGGFLACLKIEKSLVIDLIAVLEEKRGCGVARDLITASESYYHSLCSEYLVSTQSTNLASINLYRSCGFGLVAKQSTFHLVIK
jgi:ribosomal protein S18 acetylase RimI-like enzyme